MSRGGLRAKVGSPIGSNARHSHDPSSTARQCLTAASTSSYISRSALTLVVYLLPAKQDTRTARTMTANQRLQLMMHHFNGKPSSQHAIVIPKDPRAYNLIGKAALLDNKFAYITYRRWGYPGNTFDLNVFNLKTRAHQTWEGRRPTNIRHAVLLSQPSDIVFTDYMAGYITPGWLHLTDYTGALELVRHPDLKFPVMSAFDHRVGLLPKTDEIWVYDHSNKQQQQFALSPIVSEEKAFASKVAQGFFLRKDDILVFNCRGQMDNLQLTSNACRIYVRSFAYDGTLQWTRSFDYTCSTYQFDSSSAGGSNITVRDAGGAYHLCILTKFSLYQSRHDIVVELEQGVLEYPEHDSIGVYWRDSMYCISGVDTIECCHRTKDGWVDEGALSAPGKLHHRHGLFMNDYHLVWLHRRDNRTWINWITPGTGEGGWQWKSKGEKSMVVLNDFLHPSGSPKASWNGADWYHPSEAPAPDPSCPEEDDADRPAPEPIRRYSRGESTMDWE